MKKHQYQYIYDQDIIKKTYRLNGYVSLPLFFDFTFEDIKNNVTFTKSLIDPFIILYQKEKSEISEICYKLFNKNLLLKDSLFYLSSGNDKDILLKNIEKLMIHTYYHIIHNNNNLIIPLPSYYNVANDFLILHYFLESLSFPHLSFIFVSNDYHLLSIFDNNIKTNDIYWVEGEFDKFTYQLFMPNREYRVAGNWINIFKILEHKNAHHYGIIDKDGFLLENKKDLIFSDKIFFSRYAECENIWLSEEILNIFQKNIKTFSKTTFIKEVIELANMDKELTTQRFINRQNKLKVLGYPYNNENQVKNVINKYYKSIDNNDYNFILLYYDNKAIFNLLLKRISCKNIKMFYDMTLKIKKDIIALKINPII